MRIFLQAFLLSIVAGSAAVAQDSALYGKDGPRFDVAVGYQRIQANAPPGACNCFSANGGFVSGNVWLRPHFGVTAEFTGGRQSNISNLGQNLTLTTYMGGPRIVYPIHRVVPFAEVLIGGAHGSDSYFPTGNTFQTSASSLAFAPGGGIDIDINHRFSFRAVQARYLHTSFPNGTSNEQHHLTISTGIVVRFGHRSRWASSKAAPPAPEPVAAPVVAAAPPPPPPPSITDMACTSGITEVQAGTPVEIAAIVQTSPARREADYKWTASGGVVRGTGQRVTIDTSSLPPGEYRVSGRAQLTGTATAVQTCEVSFRVAVPPPPPAPPAVVRERRELEFKANMHDVFFDLNKSNLRPDAEKTVRHDAEYLKQNMDVRIQVGGFADSRGSSTYNLALGERRANAVRDALIALGIAADRIEIVTFGRDAQICTAGEEHCWQQNRRVGFVMQP